MFFCFVKNPKNKNSDFDKMHKNATIFDKYIDRKNSLCDNLRKINNLTQAKSLLVKSCFSLKTARINGGVFLIPSS